MVPIASFSFDATLACTSFNREFRLGRWARRSVALRPFPFLLRGNHGGCFLNVDVGNLEAPWRIDGPETGIWKVTAPPQTDPLPACDLRGLCKHSCGIISSGGLWGGSPPRHAAWGGFNPPSCAQSGRPSSPPLTPLSPPLPPAYLHSR